MPCSDELVKLYFRFSFNNKKIFFFFWSINTMQLLVLWLWSDCDKKLVCSRGQTICNCKRFVQTARILMLTPVCNSNGIFCIARHHKTVDQVIWSLRCGAVAHSQPNTKTFPGVDWPSGSGVPAHLMWVDLRYFGGFGLKIPLFNLVFVYSC